MTREEIKNTPEIVDFMLDKSVIADSRMKLHKRLEEICELAIEALEQESILAKIRAEIEQRARPNELYGRGNGKSIRYGLCMALEILDKYKTESEGKE